MAELSAVEELKSYMAELLSKDVSEQALYPPFVEDDGLDHKNSFGIAFLWVSFLCMFLSSCYFLQRAMARKASDRLFEFVTFLITGIASLAYLVMACGFGVHHNGTDQQFYYARYIDWLFTTPLMIWDLMELVGAPGSNIFVVVGLDVLMIVAGAIGAMCERHQIRWAFFVLGCLFFLLIVNELSALMNKGAVSQAAQEVYQTAARLTIVMWTLYPVSWALTEGTGVVGANAGCLMYCILDVISKCVFGFIIVSNRAALDSIYNAKDGYNAVSSAQ